MFTISKKSLRLLTPLFFTSIIFTFLLFLTLYLLTSHLRHGDLLVHTDVGRDLLVLEELVQTRQPTLIGPRAGIPGVFHGPLWYYLNLPVFVLVGGNPVLMGWYWWLWGVLAAAAFFWAVFRQTRQLLVSLVGTFIFSLVLIPSSAGPTNTYLANLFSFAVLACWASWYQRPTWLNAGLGWLALGVMVQFQMAFAVPLAILWLPVFIWRVSRKWPRQLWAILLFLLPLSTFVIFDLRHDWLQVRSVLSIFSSSDSSAAVAFLPKLADRVQAGAVEALNIFKLPGLYGTFVALSILILGWRTNHLPTQKAIWLMTYLYLGWWLLTLAYGGKIWSYYYFPFIGMWLYVFVLIAARLRSVLGLLLVLMVPLIISIKSTLVYQPNRFDSSSWRLLHQIAQESLAEPQRGYFVYSQDQYAYPLKYALAYYARQHPEMAVQAFQKQPQTVLVKAKDDPNNPYLTAGHWQRETIRISQEPVQVMEYPFGYQVEVYELDEAARSIPVDPNLITDLHFR